VLLLFACLPACLLLLLPLLRWLSARHAQNIAEAMHFPKFR